MNLMADVSLERASAESKQNHLKMTGQENELIILGEMLQKWKVKVL